MNPYYFSWEDDKRKVTICYWWDKPTGELRFGFSRWRKIEDQERILREAKATLKSSRKTLSEEIIKVVKTNEWDNEIIPDIWNAIISGKNSAWVAKLSQNTIGEYLKAREIVNSSYSKRKGIKMARERFLKDPFYIQLPACRANWIDRRETYDELRKLMIKWMKKPFERVNYKWEKEFKATFGRTIEVRRIKKQEEKTEIINPACVAVTFWTLVFILPLLLKIN